LKKGLLGGAVLVIGGSVPLLLRSGARPVSPRRALKLLSETEYTILAAAAARLCPGRPGDEPAWPSAAALDCAGKIDALVARLHPRAGREFRQLLNVFENALTGLVATGKPRTFTRSTPAEQDARLEAWRRSRVALFRSGYQAMKRLAHASYYSSPEVYARLGYPGPPAVPAGAVVPAQPETPAKAAP
jgi:hypothetical protein